MNFKAIVFDYGNVLAGIPGSQTSNDMIQVIGVSPEKYARAYFRYNQQVNRGEITWEQLWELVLTDLDKLDKLPAVLENNRAYEASLDQINTDVTELAVRLKKSGYKIGVLSNTTPSGAVRIHQKLAPYDLDVIHCSAETGKVKPSPDAFYDLAKALDVDIKSMIFIDDSSRSLSTADECGYTPILFTSYENLLNQLQKLKIS